MFLGFLGLCRLQLVYVANEGIFRVLAHTCIGQALLDYHLEVAVEEVKSWYVVPGLQGVSGKDDNPVLLQQLLELLRALGRGSLVPLLFAIDG